MTPIKCFLIEPVYGDDYTSDYDAWVKRQIIEWRRVDTGETKKHNYEFLAGAMWRATWYKRNALWTNETEPHLLVRCPNGPDPLDVRDWDIDSRCSNCTLQDDFVHRCWVRHGDPPNITVDKSGVTCGAGAGSILLSKWHGFLQNGFLVTA